MFRYDIDIENNSIELLRIFGFYNHKKETISLSLGMKPPRKNRKKFRATLMQLCKKQGIDSGEYLCSVNQSYPTLEELTASYIQAHTVALSALYAQMKEIRVQLIPSLSS